MNMLRKLALILVALLVLVSCVCWFYADSILNDLLRPGLVQLLSKELEAEVSIEQLSRTSTGLDIFGIQLVQETGLSLHLTRIETDFSLFGLYQRQLKGMRIIQPELHFRSISQKSTGAHAPLVLPAEFPLQIDELIVSGGEVLLVTEGRSFQFQDIFFQGALNRDFPFLLELKVGTRNPQLLRVQGNIALENNLALSFSQLEFDQRSLISQPLSFEFSPEDLGQGKTSIHLAQFDQAQLREILNVIDSSYPFPEALRFRLNGTRIDLKMTGAETRIEVRVDAGEVEQGAVKLPLAIKELVLLREQSGWTVQGEVIGPADTLLSFSTRSSRQLAEVDSFSADLQQAGESLMKVDGQPQNFQLFLAPLNLNRLESLFGSARIPKQIRALTALTARGQVKAGSDGNWLVSGDLAADNLQANNISLSQIVGRGELEFSADQFLLKQVSLTADLAQGDEFSARSEVQLSAKFAESRFDARISRLKLSQIGYMSADGQTGLGGGYLNLNGSLDGNLDVSLFDFNLTGDGGAAEFLMGSFYANLADFGGQLNLHGEFSPQSQVLTLRELQLRLPSVGVLKLSGRIGDAERAVKADLEIPDLKAAYGGRLRPMLVELRPTLKSLTLKGALSVDADFHSQPDGWQLGGFLQPQGLDATWEAQALELVAAKGRIPFNLFSGRPVSGSSTPAEQSGEISFSALSVGLASLDAGRLQLASAPNQIAFRSPLTLALAGGKVLINDLSLGVGKSGPSGSVRVKIEAVDLAVLAQELKLPPLVGNFSADLGLIRFADRELSTAGTATLDIFGGNILLRNMRYQTPFSSYPIFYADIDFTGIDLLQATRTFEFGEMNGIVDGQIYALRLFGRTPSAFRARLETRDAGKRNISVKALNNLSILSQGGLSAALSRGVYRFIDFYRYAKIGFACRLENDTFTLSGTALKDSSKYLVAGSLFPPRIDITTTTPTISFKEMLKRLNRIDRTGS